MPETRYIILDKNFIQKEDRTTPRLRALARCGCEFVLIDTLIYELCSDTKLPDLWPSLQKKLFPFADRLHLWFHNSELVRREVISNHPVAGPEDTFATQVLRNWFHSKQVYVPRDLKEIVETLHRQREVDSYEAVAPMARAFGTIIADAGQQVGIERLSNVDLSERVSDNMADERLLRWSLRACYGNPASPETYIPDAENRVTDSWFAYHNARVTLALIGIFLKKYGLTEHPGQKFPNTKLDMDYLGMLHYADALASDETAGDMNEMCNWIYDTTKKRISSSDLLSALPQESSIRLAAYDVWLESGRTHGHDVADWTTAEDHLYDQMWHAIGAPCSAERS